MKAKYPRLTFVTFNDMGTTKTAIVEGTYADLYWGDEYDQYSVYIMENGKIDNTLSWVDECDMAEIPVQMPNLAESLIEDWENQKLEWRNKS